MAAYKGRFQNLSSTYSQSTAYIWVLLSAIF
jgi:hypothetical protein